jgi:alkylation response protein AidB-like acyl-CoA dehydrogenase
MTVDHAKSREQFGRPIGSFQAVAHRAADMRSDVDAMRVLVQQAAWCLENRRSAELEVASALGFALAAARRVFRHAHQIHGAIGFSMEHDLQLFSRRAKAAELTWGPLALHEERVARAMGIA